MDITTSQDRQPTDEPNGSQRTPKSLLSGDKAERALHAIAQFEAHQQVSHMSFPQKQALVYEGHMAPGCFLFLKGSLKMTSKEFRDTFTIHVEPDANSNLSDPGSLHFYLYPECKQLDIRMPYTLELLSPSNALYIPRSLTNIEENQLLLHIIAKEQERLIP